MAQRVSEYHIDPCILYVIKCAGHGFQHMELLHRKASFLDPAKPVKLFCMFTFSVARCLALGIYQALRPA